MNEKKNTLTNLYRWLAIHSKQQVYSLRIIEFIQRYTERWQIFFFFFKKKTAHNENIKIEWLNKLLSSIDIRVNEWKFKKKWSKNQQRSSFPMTFLYCVCATVFNLLLFGVCLDTHAHLIWQDEVFLSIFSSSSSFSSRNCLVVRWNICFYVFFFCWGRFC